MSERGADGKFITSVNDEMNQLMLQSLYNKPSQRLMRRLFDAEARRKQMEADNE